MRNRTAMGGFPQGKLLLALKLLSEEDKLKGTVGERCRVTVQRGLRGCQEVLKGATSVHFSNKKYIQVIVK